MRTVSMTGLLGRIWLPLGGVGLLAAALAGCSGSDSSSTNVDGGSSSVGGSVTTGGLGAPAGGASAGGGAKATGGSPSTGGTSGVGGTSAAGGSPSTGGLPAAGGAVATGGIGNTAGASATGGAKTTGGASNAGGLNATGGNNAGGANTGGSKATGGTSTAGGTGNTGGSKTTGGVSTVGGAGNTGGSKATGGANATGGSKATGGTSAMGGASSTGGTTTTLDCGPNGWVVENHGPTANRVNYVILGDGYTTADLVAGGTLETHINKAMTRRFSANGEVYSRYRNFVNICVIKLVSTGAICSGNSALGCCGDDASRLANCTTSSVNAAFNALPASLSTDWRAVVLNGSSWWNTGAATMLWSGGNADAPGAALHEGGHGFHQLADEYCASGSGTSCGPDTNGTGATGTEYAEVNSTGNPATTGGKWDLWIGFNQTGATGIQSTFQGSRYVDSGQYRPSANSMMNSLFGTNPNTSFNPVSREQMIMTIWRVVKPIDSTTPAAGAVSNPATLSVNVIDPAVINVDWNVDGTTTTNGGTTLDTSTLAAGTHTITATAYDNATTDLVRYRTSTCPASVTGNYCSRTAWKNSTQTVTWTVTK